MLLLLSLLSSGSALVGPRPARVGVVVRAEQAATLGLGCFWAPSEALLAVDGVAATRCGYAGAAFAGATPSYASVCGGDGNVEAVRVTYDDAVVSFEDVLDAAFDAAAPVLGSRQYAPVVFARDAAEAARAEAWIAAGDRRADGLERRAFGVEAAPEFWVAEAYFSGVFLIFITTPAR